ncbi:hypothetical protein VBM90_02970 [Mycoplasma sp. 2704]|uniref:hypothetical protein n=1 Tax=Mycoplasma sp. 2704 TaxID=3108529 RepID=UPI002B1D57E8|nr:hypothetical protein [Mycoplasma sp. 2704]MEA4134745.1 hypothetical protein [Mycoplasma sp. 2704]
MNKKTKELDQFFTNPIVSDFLVEKIIGMFPSVRDSEIIESSVGSGNFVDSLIKYKIKMSQIKAYDIDLSNYPHDNGVECDYLQVKLKYKKNRFVIGNPPFGYRGKLALDFLNKALTESDVVCFILPKIFSRYSMQKHVEPNAKLVYESVLSDDSFLVENHKYNVNCIFQIWVNKRKEIYIDDKRLKLPKSIKTDDFETFIHNNTMSTLKYFDKSKYNWDFAIHRQGFYDYNEKIFDQNKLHKNRQYVFVKLKNNMARKVFELIDFESLSRGNTTVRGFSLTDLVEEYNKQKYFLENSDEIRKYFDKLVINIEKIF